MTGDDDDYLLRWPRDLFKAETARLLDGRGGMSGWIEDAWEERAEGWKRPPRRYYRLTDDGRTQLGAVVQRAGREQSFTGLRVGFA